MLEKRLAYLLDGYIKNTLNGREIDELRKCLSHDEASRNIAERMVERRPELKVLFPANQEDTIQRVDQVLRGRLNETGGVVKNMLRTSWMKMAAAVIVLIIGGWGIYRLGNNRIMAVDIKSEDLTLQARVTDKFLTLPDGSTVVVHAGSTLEYDKSFNENTREIKLVGEAYFDVKEDKSRPFIIKSGDIKTTVLGTSFLVKAYPESKAVTVTVTSGKVRVEDKKQVLGELEKDQQLVYHQDKLSSEQRDVNVVKEMNWVNKGVEFNSAYFGNITDALSQRYGVTIMFSNPRQANCQMTASFSGTETLENVLRRLALLTNSTYSQEGKVITITGEDCEN